MSKIPVPSTKPRTKADTEALIRKAAQDVLDNPLISEEGKKFARERLKGPLTKQIEVEKD